MHLFTMQRSIPGLMKREMVESVPKGIPGHVRTAKGDRERALGSEIACVFRRLTGLSARKDPSFLIA